MPRSTSKPKTTWTYLGREVVSLNDMPKEVIGFVYRITNHTTGMYYIGRKMVAGKKKVKLTLKEKQLPENARKTFKYEYKESAGWKSYVGSNQILKSEVSQGHLITKEILTYCFSKAQLSLEETRNIICGGAIEDVKSYNGWVTCKIYKNQILNNAR